MTQRKPTTKAKTLIEPVKFKSVLSKARPGLINSQPWPVLALDPGGTTGYSVWKHGELKEAGQLATPNAQPIEELIRRIKPREVVMEEFKLYPWKAKQQSWSDIPTLQLIGAIKYILDAKGTPYTLQSAHSAKGFSTNEKLVAWGLWQTGKGHANDSIRHGVYYLLFHKPKAG